ncbi:Deoxynucleoside triphosphate triphosphohydrolase SAMHD1-like 4, partial [Homarus americanus]
IILAEEDDPQLKDAQNILRNILTRKLYVYVGQTQPKEAGSSNKITKADLLTDLQENIPENSTLKKDDFDVLEVKLDFGMGDTNPIEHVHFYNKIIHEVIFRVLIKSYSEEHLKEAHGIFKAVCEKLKMKEPSVDSWSRLLTSANLTNLESVDQ